MSLHLENSNFRGGRKLLSLNIILTYKNYFKIILAIRECIYPFTFNNSMYSTKDHCSVIGINLISSKGFDFTRG